MLFRDYMDLLYQAYLQDKGYLTTLRDRIKSKEFNKDHMHDPGFENWKSISPRRQETHQRKRNRFYPNPYDPEQGIYTHESYSSETDRTRIIREYLLKRKASRANEIQSPLIRSLHKQ